MKNGYRNKDGINKIIDFMIEKGHDFTYRQIGSSTGELELPMRKILTKNSGNFIAGGHLIRLVLKDIGQRIESKVYVPKNTDNDRRNINVVMFDKENIKKFIDKPIVAIDINGCYWNTAHNLGIISNKMFLEGMKGGDKWKKARNASIGSLNTLIREYKPINGELIMVNMYRRPYNIARLDIIDHVWRIANDISLKLKEGFCMFLTDCFFVLKEYEQDVYSLLESFGYSGKSTNVIFEKYEESGRYFKVFWEEKKQKGKYVEFTDKQLVSWKK